MNVVVPIVFFLYLYLWIILTTPNVGVLKFFKRQVRPKEFVRRTAAASSMPSHMVLWFHHCEAMHLNASLLPLSIKSPAKGNDSEAFWACYQ